MDTSDGSTHLRVGIGDDCAVLTPGRQEELVVTTDLFLENVHFRRDWHTPEAAGHRCLARGLSDVAAMGARPVAVFLSFALPPTLAGAWAGRFLDGLLRLAREHRVPLAGGDTAQAPAWPHAQASRRRLAALRSGRPASSRDAGSPPGEAALLAADIVVLGAVRRGRAVLRSGARAGDLLYVTGSLGGAAAELAQLRSRPQPRSRRAPGRTPASGVHPHLFPEPRLAAGRALAGLATAAIDVSDGLSTDLAHLCEESGLAAILDAPALPIHPLAARAAEPLALALHGGEDYELLFTAPPQRRVGFSLAGTPVTCIGRMLPRRRGQPRVALLTADGSRSPLPNRGWQHLAGAADPDLGHK